MVPIGYARRLGMLLGMLTAAAVVASLAPLPAPASALTITVPTTLPGPLAPIELPVGGSASTGTGGDSIGVTVTVPDGSGVSVTLPGVPSLPALPVGPTGPVTLPTTPGTVVTPAPTPVPGSGVSTPTASPTRGGSDPAVALPGNETITRRAVPAPVPRFAVGAAPPAAAATGAGHGRVDATLAAQPADSFLHQVPGIAARLALWAALAAIVFVLYLLVGSTVRDRRRRSPRVSGRVRNGRRPVPAPSSTWGSASRSHR